MNTTTTPVATSPVVAIVDNGEAWPRWLHERARQRRGELLVVDIAPLPRIEARDVAEAVLDSLGKSRLLTAARRDAETMAHAWLSVATETDAIVADAALLSPDLISDLIATFTGFGIRPWFVVRSSDHHDPDELETFVSWLVDGWDAELVDANGLASSWPDTLAPDDLDDIDVSWPTVPRVDGMFFRTAVADLLDADDAALVDRYFVTTIHELRTKIAEITGRNQRRQLEQLLRRGMNDIADDEQLLTHVRATQVAAVTEGFHVAVDPIRFYGGCSAIPRRGHAVRDHWWRRLDQYRDPDVPAVAALNIADMDLADIAGLTTADVTEHADGTVTVTGASGATVDVAGPAARFVRAAVAWRLLDADGGPLFATHRSANISDRRIGSLATEALDVGVKHTAAKPWRKHPDAARWLANYGIKISKLSKEPNS